MGEKIVKKKNLILKNRYQKKKEEREQKRDSFVPHAFVFCLSRKKSLGEIYSVKNMEYTVKMVKN